MCGLLTLRSRCGTFRHSMSAPHHRCVSTTWRRQRSENGISRRQSWQVTPLVRSYWEVATRPKSGCVEAAREVSWILAHGGTGCSIGIPEVVEAHVRVRSRIVGAERGARRAAGSVAGLRAIAAAPQKHCPVSDTAAMLLAADPPRECIEAFMPPQTRRPGGPKADCIKRAQQLYQPPLNRVPGVPALDVTEFDL